MNESIHQYENDEHMREFRRKHDEVQSLREQRRLSNEQLADAKTQIVALSGNEDLALGQLVAAQERIGELKEVLQSFHDKADAYNARHGTAEKLCVFCEGASYSPVSGIGHSLWCPILQARQALKEEA